MQKVATCEDPVKDFFSRFALAWDFRPDSSKQLRYWLDPLNTTKMKLEGKSFLEDDKRCVFLTNLDDTDSHQNLSLPATSGFSGYWGGTIWG